MCCCWLLQVLDHPSHVPREAEPVRNLLAMHMTKEQADKAEALLRDLPSAAKVGGMCVRVDMVVVVARQLDPPEP